jgi:hypothetical protein
MEMEWEFYVITATPWELIAATKCCAQQRHTWRGEFFGQNWESRLVDDEVPLTFRLNLPHDGMNNRNRFTAQQDP